MKSGVMVLIFCVLNVFCLFSAFCADGSNNDSEIFTFRVAPDSVRVWRGYKANSIDNSRFFKLLGTVFIPGTPLFQAPLGLTAYLPAILSADAPDFIPDEIALVFYKSKEKYKETFKTIAGRAYGALHGTVFSFSKEKRSTSAWPKLLKDIFVFDTPYYLFNLPIDWQKGIAVLYVAGNTPGMTKTDFKNSLFQYLKRLQKTRPIGLDGAIVVATGSYFIYWEHWLNSSFRNKYSNINELNSFSVEYLKGDAVEIKSSGNIYSPNPGLKAIVGGEIFNFSFPRK